MSDTIDVNTKNKIGKRKIEIKNNEASLRDVPTRSTHPVWVDSVSRPRRLDSPALRRSARGKGCSFCCRRETPRDYRRSMFFDLRTYPTNTGTLG